MKTEIRRGVEVFAEHNVNGGDVPCYKGSGQAVIR